MTFRFLFPISCSTRRTSVHRANRVRTTSQEILISVIHYNTKAMVRLQQFIRNFCWSCLLLSLGLSSTLQTQAQSQRPKVGLVLSGGGAKGSAHIGALKVIEEAGIPIDYICGTSMGAIVGGLYAIGYNASELDSIVRAQDWMYLFSDKIERSHRSFQSKQQNDTYLLSIPFNQKIKLDALTGVMKGQSILNKFSALTIGYHDMTTFDSLPIPYACVAADLVSGTEVILREGSLPLAMRTSMSVPGFFEPVRKDSMVMIDGGVLNNFPTDIIRKMGADIIIGVDVSTTGLEPTKLNTLLDVANRIAFLSGENKYAENLKYADIYINPRLIGYEATDFKPTAIDTMITMGEKATREVWDELIALKHKLLSDGETYQKPVHVAHDNDSISIDRMHIEGLSSYDEEWIINKTGFIKGSKVSYSDVSDFIFTIQGLDAFKSVSYKIIKDDKNEKILMVYVEEKSRGSLNVGMHIDTEDVASVLLQATSGFGSHNQHKVAATAKINQNPWFNLRYSRTNHKMRSLGLNYTLSYKDFRLLERGRRIYNINFLRNSFKIGYKDYSQKDLRFEIGMQYDIFSDVSNFFTPNYVQYKESDEDLISAYLKIDVDAMDDVVTPTKGVLFTSRMQLYGNDLFESKRYALGDISLNIVGAIPMGPRFCLLPELFGRVLVGNKVPGYFSNYIGGEYDQRYVIGQHAFYGVHFAEVMDNALLGTRLALRYQIAKKHYVSCIGNYLFNSHDLRDIFKERTQIGGAIKYTYNSIIGPISASIDFSDRSNDIGFFAGIGHFF